MTDRYLSPCGLIDLRLGRWQDVLADIGTCDAVICDPPYSPRQAEGFRSSNDMQRKRGDGERGDGRYSGTITYNQGMPYAPLTPADARGLAQRFAGAAWLVMFGDHLSFRWHEAAAAKCGRLVFAPVVWIRGNGPRFQGDGPCSAAEYICASRLRGKCSIGSLPGWYEYQPLRGEATDSRIVTGQKPLPLMQAIVRDYTRPGDLVVDPFAGGGTTALACAIEGRRCITSEMDEITFAKAKARLQRGYTRNMLTGDAVKAKQGRML